MNSRSPRQLGFTLLVSVLLLASAVTGTVQGQPSGQVLGRPEISVYAPNASFSPGEETTLELFISNNPELSKGGPERFENRVSTARSLSVEVDAGNAPLSVKTGTYPVGTVSESTHGPVPFRIEADEGASPGTYELPVEIRYDYTRLISYETRSTGIEKVDYAESQRTLDTTISVEITDESTFRIVDVSANVSIGESGVVDVILENVGQNTARDVTVSLASSNGAIRLDGIDIDSLNSNIEFNERTTATRHIGTLGAGERKAVQFTAAVNPNAQRQPYALETTVTYTTPSGTSTASEPLSTGFTPAPKQSFTLTNTNSTVQIGRDGSLTGTIRNDGPQPITEAAIRVSATAGVQPVGGQYALGQLDVGETARFEIPVTVNSTDASLKQIHYTLLYTNPQNDQERQQTLASRVTITPRQSLLTIRADAVSVTARETKVVNVSIVNNGAEVLKNVRSFPDVGGPLELDGGNEFIPILQPGETATIAVEVSANSTALPGTYPLDMRFQYETAQNEARETQSPPIGIEVVAPDTDGLSVPILVGGILVVLLVGGLVWYVR